MKKSILFLMCLLLAASMVFIGCERQSASPDAGAAVTGVLPRNETLFFAGLSWSVVTRWNPYGIGGSTYNIGMGPNGHQSIFESLFHFNQLDESINPHIGTAYTWDGYNLRVTIRNDVRFNDGTPLTIDDVVHSFKIHQEYTTPRSGIWSGGFLLDVVAINATTLEFRGNPERFHPGRMLDEITSVYISNKAEWDALLRVSDPQRGTPQSNQMAVAQEAQVDPLPRHTGPYTPIFWDETRTVLERVDNWWGVAKTGRLPAPRYLAHNIFRDNAAGDRALRALEVDVSQQFMNQVWTMWEQDGLPISTFIPVPPYFFPASTPYLLFNTQVPGLDDPLVRRAIRDALDYPALAANAVSGYSVPTNPHIMVPVPAELALIDEAALRPYQWSEDRATRVAAINRELDAAGWVRGADGIRARGGQRLAFVGETVSGWSDYQASLEIAAQNARDVGIMITTQFLTSPIITQNRNDGTFEIAVNGAGSTGPNNPWGRLNSQLGSSEMPPVGVTNTIQNWGRWMNAEVDRLLVEIPTATEARRRELYTRINIIALQEAPIAILWYRPASFHTVNSSVWEGHPTLGDGTNIPPVNHLGGYAINALFHIRPRAR